MNAFNPFRSIGRLVRKQQNLLALIVALGLGQGLSVVVFLALAWSGRADVVGGFSLGFQIATLSMFVTDFGGAVYLSRLSATRVRAGRSHLPRNAFGAILLYRLGIALLTTVVILVAASAPLFNDFTRAFLLGASPAALVYTFNIAGALDGVGRAGVAGLSTALYFVLPTTGLAAQSLSGEPSPFLLGALFSGGVIGAVIIQHAYARISGKLLLDLPGALARMRHPITADKSRAVRELFFYSVSGQLLARGQLIIAGLYFPMDTLGAIALAKQIANGASQVIGLFRRIELPNLVQRARAGAPLTVVEGLTVQKWGTLAALCFAVLFTAAAFVPASVAGDAEPALFLLAFHAPAVVTTALLAAGMQTAIARNQAGIAMLCAWSVTLTTLTGVWLVSQAGVAPALFLVEAAVQAVVLAVFLFVSLRGADKRS